MSPFVIFIFGATGDLVQHKLLPALFSLYKNKFIGDKFYIVAFSRKELTDKDYREMLGEELKNVEAKDPEWKKFAKKIRIKSRLIPTAWI